jgi:choline-sulfatase
MKVGRAHALPTRDQAIAWLRHNASNDRRWMLFVGFVAPHFPLIAPQSYIDQYPPDAMPLPSFQPTGGYVRHPWVAAQELFLATDTEFGTDNDKRRRAISAYYALCTMVDDHVALCSIVRASPKRPQ